ncbi:hypothetical protein [Dysgonomonas sp. HGC4]|uniref:hypothetical protein n=1 Tax=Dysgonomonas sp. HGC4 TaxID=1658009 RepID=UPI000680EF23|nr:hypothetical protein [Dysgonomonas sp. HGC4]MBD8349339.1 hypothetical protein [Dysgonomonas sp. HGC4]
MKFDATAYFKEINTRLKKTKDGKYRFCKSTGLSSMEGVVANLRSDPAYFVLDDTQDGYVYKKGGGYFSRRMFVIFVLKKFTLGSMVQQTTAMQECRDIFTLICTQLVKDRNVFINDQIFFDTDRIPYYELDGHAIAGCTGIYFMFSVDEPTNLCYDKSQWYDE